MSDDSFTEVTSRGWGSRLGSSIKGVLFGFVIGGAGVVLLWWNEGRAVITAKSLAEGAASVVSIGSETVSGSHEGKLVHVTGLATTTETLTDPAFRIEAQAIALRRAVEMYQWQESRRSETRKKLGGGEETVTTYSYDKTWADHRIDSSEFKKPDGHSNPPRMPYESQDWQAATVRLGAFTLSSGLVGQMQAFEPLAPPATTSPRLPEAARRLFRTGNGFYLGNDPNSPQIGDLRVSFSAVRPSTVSIVARQSGSSLAGYQTKAGRTLEMLESGDRPADAMFKAAQQRNTVLTWILRAVGFLAIFLGLYSIFKPLAVLGDVVPFIGSALRAGIGVLAFLITVVVWLVVVALAWLYYRPILGLALLAVAVVALVLLVQRVRRSRSPATPPPLPTP